MKAYEIGPQSGLASLTPVTRPDPVAGPGEAVIKVLEICLNHRDLLVLEGRYGALRPEARVPVSEGVGVVLAWRMAPENKFDAGASAPVKPAMA